MHVLDRLDAPHRPYTVVLADPPWQYSGDPTRDQAAGKHYAMLSLERLAAMPVPALLAPQSVLYLWATGPKLPLAVALLEAWRLRYLGVAFVWVKCRSDGTPIAGQGVRPTLVKPTTEFVLAASPVRRGRPLPVLDEALGQVVLASRPGERHSAKPAEVRQRIQRLHGRQRRLELFARDTAPGWDAWGCDVGSTPWR
ncbi:MAG: DNA methyltransferase [Rhodanobacteraceae bacterium]|nr:DNA methyltransferase [Rhodanobacteraceae bacterium]